jgi:hypothetical protein
MPCPTNGRTLRGVGVATHDRKASTPRLPQREAEKAKVKNPRDDHASNKAGFCNTFSMIAAQKRTLREVREGPEAAVKRLIFASGSTSV